MPDRYSLPVLDGGGGDSERVLRVKVVRNTVALGEIRSARDVVDMGACVEDTDQIGLVFIENRFMFTEIVRWVQDDGTSVRD